MIPAGSTLWEDINSSIQKLDPMHVETYNIKYRAQECHDVKEEPGMYLGDENQVYVQGGYQQVFDMSPQSQSQQHCDQHFAYTIRSVATISTISYKYYSFQLLWLLVGWSEVQSGPALLW